jgi:small subunit ribosomal protein S20
VSSNKSANKAARAAERKRQRNRLMRSSTKAHISRVRGLISTGELELAQREAAVAIGSIDRATSRGIIHRNKGARLKSQLAGKLNAAVMLSQSSEHGEVEAEQS